MRINLHMFFVALFTAAVATAESADPVPLRPPTQLIPVTVIVAVESTGLKEGGPIPVAVTIHNGLPGEIRHSTFSLKPNGWNGETALLTLVDIYREGESRGLYLARPKVEVPLQVSGMGSHRIESGKALTVHTDASKWEIVGGWKPGKYQVTVRVERLDVDDGRCHLSVHSAPVAFVIK